MWKLFWLALASGVLSSAHATSMVVMDVEEQADESHALIVARVGASTVVQTERMVYTDTVLEVQQVLAGDAPERVILRQAGGVLPERTVFIAGDAKLEPGMEIAAFVRGRAGRWYLTALGQSVWFVEQDQLVQAIDPSHLLQRDREGRVVPAVESPRAYETVEQLRDAVRGLELGGAL